MGREGVGGGEGVLRRGGRGNRGMAYEVGKGTTTVVAPKGQGGREQ
jgi:hypothetical protein